jgi:hypothetical protein
VPVGKADTGQGAPGVGARWQAPAWSTIHRFCLDRLEVVGEILKVVLGRNTVGANIGLKCPERRSGLACGASERQPARSIFAGEIPEFPLANGARQQPPQDGGAVGVFRRLNLFQVFDQVFRYPCAHHTFVLHSVAALLGIHDCKFHDAARAGRACAVIIVPYLAALTLVSLLTPGTIVNIGDSYCYDLWCLGVKQVNATPKGQDTLYTAEVRIFVDSKHPHYLLAQQAKGFFYVLDDQGRRYPLLREPHSSPQSRTTGGSDQVRPCRTNPMRSLSI